MSASISIFALTWTSLKSYSKSDRDTESQLFTKLGNRLNESLLKTNRNNSDLFLFLRNISEMSLQVTDNFEITFSDIFECS